MARIVSGPLVTIHVTSGGSSLGGAVVTPTPGVYSDPEMTAAAAKVTANGGGDVQFYAPPGVYTFACTGADPIESVEVLSPDLGAVPAPHAVNTDWLEGAAVWGYGNSYMAMAQNPPLSNRRYLDRVAQRCRSQYLTSVTEPGRTVASYDNALNYGVPAFLSIDAAKYMLGTVAATGLFGSRAGTFTPSANNRGVAILDCARNDSGYDGARMQNGFTAALDVMIRSLRAQSIVQDNDASFAYTGTWTAQSAVTTLPGTKGHFTQTNGDKVTITTASLASPTDCFLTVIGWNSTLGGGTFTLKVDGVDITATLPVQTTDAMCDNTHGVLAGAYVPMALPLGTLPAGVHTIVLTHAGGGSGSKFLEVCQFVQSSPTPPTVVLMKAAQLPSAGYSFYGGTASWATDQTYNGIIDTVAARFGALSTLTTGVKATADLSVITIDPNVMGWDQTTMIASGDANSLHPNDKGQACYADAIMTALNRLTARNGLNVL